LSPVALSPSSWSRSSPVVPSPSSLTLWSVASSLSALHPCPWDPAKVLLYLSCQSRKNLLTRTFSWVMIIT
jgi:hypothetical protein